MKLKVLLILLCYLCYSVTNAQTIPKKLLIYYGYPSGINGATSVQEAATHFAQYDFIIWGDSLELQSFTGAEAAQAKWVLQAIRSINTNTKVFGYMYLGTTIGTELVNVSDFDARLDSIRAFGFDGVLFDECGYSPLRIVNSDTIPNCDRQRLVAAADLAHAKRLSIIGNTQFPKEILRNESSSFNENNLPTPFTLSDYYLYESYLIRFGDYYRDGSQVPFNEWEYWRLTKSQELVLETPTGLVPIPTLSVGTADSGFPDYTCKTINFSQSKIDSLFAFQWYGAWMNGHLATGWGECSYAANNIAPPRPTPTISNPGVLNMPTQITLLRGLSKTPTDSVYYFRETSTGRIWLNAGPNKHYGFTEHGFNESTEGSSWFELNTWSMYHVPTQNENVIIRKHENAVFIPTSSPKAKCKSIVTTDGTIFTTVLGAVLDCGQ